MSNADNNETVLRRNPIEVVQRLQQEAQKNQVFKDVAHVFALRERTRQEVTTGTLKLTMAAEGFQHSLEDLSKVLGFLASLGIGRVERDSNKRVKALRDIKITLQSIGKAALGGKEPLVKFQPARSFENLPVPMVSTDVVPKAVTPSIPKPAEVFAVSITVDINGQEVTFPTTLSLSLKAIHRLVLDLNASKTL